jgi:nucleoside diphosphate kinase
MKTPRIYYGALAVFCVIALCTGFVSAADTTQAMHAGTHGKGTGHPAFDLTNTTVQQQIIARYEQQGVDVTALQTAFQSGDTAAAKSWLEAHRPARPQSANRGPTKGFDVTNTTVQQEILARYAKQGVDTTGLAAAFQSGNMTDVKSWMGSHRPAAPGFAKGSFGKTPDLTNTTVQQDILARFEKQGVDTSALKTAFQNGDTSAVKSWFNAFFKAHPHTGHGQSGESKASA